MLLLDVIIRYPTIALLLFFTILVFRDARKTDSALYAGLLSISIAALLLGTPHPDLMLPKIPHIFVRLIDVPSMVLTWWLGRSLFEDNFKLGKLEWGSLIIIVPSIVMMRLHELQFINSKLLYLEYFISTLSAIMMMHLIYVTLSGRHDDVIESRRQMRFYFVIGLVTVALLMIVGERLYNQSHPLELSLFRAAITFPLVLWGLLWLSQLQPEKLAFQRVKTIINTAPSIDPRDQALNAMLMDEMQVKKAYAEPGLTISTLAERFSVPEHRLRSLINQGLGYRNFSSFVNHYRIEAIKSAMQLPENARVPVLTLAMDVGFNSLAPFNRAFLASTGQTPTAYRARLLAEANQG